MIGAKRRWLSGYFWAGFSGVETLEELGLKVNPSRSRLEPTRAHAALLVGAWLAWR